MCALLVTCQAAGSRHPLVNIVTLGSVGVRVVEHGAGQGGAVVLGHGGHTGSNWRRRVTRLLRQRRVDAVRHRQRRAHAARRGSGRRLVGRGGAATRARVRRAHAPQRGGGVPLRGVRRTVAARGAGALGRGQGRGEDAGEGFGFGYDGGAVGTAD